MIVHTTKPQGVVYEIDCSCGQSYVGETSRPINTRIKEHKTSTIKSDSKSAISDHISNCPNHNINWDNVHLPEARELTDYESSVSTLAELAGIMELHFGWTNESLLSPIKIAQRNRNPAYFGGQCIISGDIILEEGRVDRYTSTYRVNCSFTEYFSVAFGLYSLSMTVYIGCLITRRAPRTGCRMWVFTLIDAVIAIVTLISCCVISVGFLVFCDRLFKERNSGTYILSCIDEEENQRWSWNLSVSSYQEYLTVAQTSSWASFFIWTLQAVLGILHSDRNLQPAISNVG